MSFKRGRKPSHAYTPYSQPVPDLPSRWEAMLAKLGLDGADVLGMLKGNGDKAPIIRQWVRANAHRAFVPERIVDHVLGSESRWLV